MATRASKKKSDYGPIYKGHEGQYSWLLHRITGVAIILFLFAHVIDTAVVGWGPNAYNRVVRVYENPVVRLLELGLVAAVLYHSFNGIKILLVDFFPSLAKHIRVMGIVTVDVFLASMAVRHVDHGRPDHRPDQELRWRPPPSPPRPAATRSQPPARLPGRPRSSGRRVRAVELALHADLGTAAAVLAVGHVLIMHVVDEGVGRVDFGFVATRWASPFWRTWDWMLLVLALIHGINGLRVITLDYVRQPGIRLTINMVFYVLGFTLFVLGSVIVFTFDPSKWPGYAG